MAVKNGWGQTIEAFELGSSSYIVMLCSRDVEVVMFNEHWMIGTMKTERKAEGLALQRTA